jgi:dTDP-glucose 4,6-dehydratase
MKKKILITGSCGFVMGNFIRKAIYERTPYNFVSVDKVQLNSINSIYWNKNHIFHIADIKDRHIIDIIFQFEKPDIVIHNATEDFDNELMPSTNIVGTQNIIDMCLRHNVERLIYTSTDEVYDYSDSIIDETFTVNPKTLFSATKAAAELLIRTAQQSHGLNYNIIRCSNNYGPRQACDELIPNAIESILKDESVYLDKDRSCDWTHVFDYCSAILSILENGKNNEVYNVTSNQEFSDIEVVHKISSIMNKPDVLSKVKYYNSQYKRGKMSSDKIKSIGWKPFYKFKDGIVGTTEWYTNNKWFLR